MSSAFQRRSLIADLRWGATWGFLVGLCLSLFVAVLFAIRGPQLFLPYGTTLWLVVGLYLVGGLAGGLITGLLRPLAKWRWGAALIGVFAAIPVGLGCRLMQAGFAPWELNDSLTMMIFSVALGASVGWIYWGIFRST